MALMKAISCVLNSLNCIYESLVNCLVLYTLHCRINCVTVDCSSGHRSSVVHVRVSVCVCACVYVLNKSATTTAFGVVEYCLSYAHLSLLIVLLSCFIQPALVLIR